MLRCGNIEFKTFEAAMNFAKEFDEREKKKKEEALMKWHGIDIVKIIKSSVYDGILMASWQLGIKELALSKDEEDKKKLDLLMLEETARILYELSYEIKDVGGAVDNSGCFIPVMRSDCSSEGVTI